MTATDIELVPTPRGYVARWSNEEKSPALRAHLDTGGPREFTDLARGKLPSVTGDAAKDTVAI